ncbi:MAG: hypothetical protein KDK38_00825 [Leptospiraceae bacterium]|nr:hypothetical protein [Leptospiraceae bacterium]
MIKKLHYFSGLTISIFVALHLFNHAFSIAGAEKHIEMMSTLRYFYRNIFIEILLLVAIATQIVTGLRLFIMKRKIVSTVFDKLQIWSGLYLAIFFLIHLSAVLAGRIILKLDTNFYFGVAGLNAFPFNLFFIPYYTLAILSFFAHIAALHNRKMSLKILGLTPQMQSIVIFLFGFLFSIFILFGLTNKFTGVQIPAEYKVLIGN